LARRRRQRSIDLIAIDSGWKGIFAESPAYHAIRIERVLLPPQAALALLEGDIRLPSC
jgi:hypothetical protein